jgi:cation diffusion facilitator CzcD-associated flavoprotein CzcO
VGGTWSSERLYEHLYSNNLVGMLEYSDFPMDFETFGVAPGSHVPGSVLHRYLTAYAEYFGVFSRIRFGATVKTTELQENGSWLIHYELKNGQEKAKEVTLLGNKLVLATGTTSEPIMPLIKGSEIFRGHIFNFKDVPNRTDISTAKNIVVLGGSKSAADAVYMNACKGRHVDWVIRGKTRFVQFTIYSHVLILWKHLVKDPLGCRLHIPHLLS